MQDTATHGERLALNGGSLNADAAREALSRQFPGVNRVARHRFVMAPDLADLVAADRKLTTIRFEKSGVEYPASNVLPLFVADRAGNHDSLCFFAELSIQEVRYKSFSELDEDDAHADGFSTLPDLLETLRNFYGALDSSHLVCIYSFEIAHRGAASD